MSGTPKKLRVAVIYNTKDKAPHKDAKLPEGVEVPDDLKAELDSWETVLNYCKFIAALGHEVVPVHGDEFLPTTLIDQETKKPKYDICWNTCEGYRGFDREAQVPALLEMIGIPYSFSRPLAMALTLDKAMTKRVLAFHGITSPLFQEFLSPKDPLDEALRGRFPLFVKPNAEGTGMGITVKSLVNNEAELRERLNFLLTAYGQSVLVEEFIPGRDVTCGVIGNFPPFGKGVHVTAINEVNYAGFKNPEGKAMESTGQLFYSRKIKALAWENYSAICPADLPKDIEMEVKRLSVETFRVTGCFDGARVDFRLDSRFGLRPVVLELNAIPGMNSDSDLTVCVMGEKRTHGDLVQNIFAAACERNSLEHNLVDPRFPINWPPVSATPSKQQ